VTPYYADDLVTLYHGDSRELLPFIEADVLVTDPPYGVAFSGKVTKHTTNTVGYTTGDDAAVGPEVVRQALERVERAAVFTGNRLLHAYPKPDDVGCVFCPSGAGSGPWGFTLFNPILFYGKRPGTPRPTSIQSFDRAPADASWHPCPKPTRWMTWLVSLASVEGETVLDPFAGSGSTLVAAKSLNRRAIGIELEERYCAGIAGRLRQDVLGLTA
jgi:DNA modification methylase